MPQEEEEETLSEVEETSLLTRGERSAAIICTNMLYLCVLFVFIEQLVGLSQCLHSVMQLNI